MRDKEVHHKGGEWVMMLEMTIMSKTTDRHSTKNIWKDYARSKNCY